MLGANALAYFASYTNVATDASHTADATDTTDDSDVRASLWPELQWRQWASEPVSQWACDASDASDASEAS